MDWKEALEGLRELIDPLCTDDQFDYEREIEKAIEAVEKQITEKPIIETEYGGKPDKAKCPCCGLRFPDIGGATEAYGECEQQDYCEHCGQAIDWSDWE